MTDLNIRKLLGLSVHSCRALLRFVNFCPFFFPKRTPTFNPLLQIFIYQHHHHLSVRISYPSRRHILKKVLTQRNWIQMPTTSIRFSFAKLVESHVFYSVYFIVMNELVISHSWLQILLGTCFFFDVVDKCNFVFFIILAYWDNVVIQFHFVLYKHTYKHFNWNNTVDCVKSTVATFSEISMLAVPVKWLQMWEDD